MATYTPLRSVQQDSADLIPTVGRTVAPRTPDVRQTSIVTPGTQIQPVPVATTQPPRTAPVIDPQPQQPQQPQSPAPTAAVQPQAPVAPVMQPAPIPTSGNARTDAHRTSLLQQAPAHLQGLVNAPLTDPRVMALSPQDQHALASLRVDVQNGTPGTDVVNFGGRGLSLDEANAVSLLEAAKRNPAGHQISPEQLEAARAAVAKLQGEFDAGVGRGVSNPLHGFERGFADLLGGLPAGNAMANTSNVAATTHPTVPAGSVSGGGLMSMLQSMQPDTRLSPNAPTQAGGRDLSSIAQVLVDGQKITPDNTLRGTRIGFDVNPGNLRDSVLEQFNSQAALVDQDFRDNVEQLGKQTAAMGRTGSGMYDKGFRRISDRAQTARDAILGNLTFDATRRDLDRGFETDLAQLAHTIGERGYDDRLAREAMGDERDRIGMLSAGMGTPPSDSALVQALLLGAGQFGANAGQINSQLGDTAQAATPYIAQLLKSIFGGSGGGGTTTTTASGTRTV